MRLSPHTAQHLWSFSMDIHEASVPISPAPQCIPRGQLARSLGTFGPIFPKARGLRPQSSSWCTWLSHAPTTMPLPTLPEGLGVSLGSPLPTSHSPWSHPLFVAPQTEHGVETGLPMHSSTGPTGSPGVELTSVRLTVSVSLADMLGKVCQGHSSPKDDMRFM